MIIRVSIKAKLVLLAVAALIAPVIVIATLVHAIDDVESSLETVYRDRVVPLKQLKTVSDAFAVEAVDGVHKVRDGFLSPTDAAAALLQSKQKAASAWADYKKTYLTEEETYIAQRVEPLMNKAVSALDKLSALYAGQDKALVEEFAVRSLYPTIDPLTSEISALVDLQLRVAKERLTEAEHEREERRHRTAVLLVCGALATGAGIFFGARSIVKPLRQIRRATASIAERQYTFRVAVNSTDEIADLAAAFNAMAQTVSDHQEELKSERDAAIETNAMLSEAIEEIQAQNEQLQIANEEIERQITLLREQAVQIELSNVRLSELDREKSELLSIAAHDLKNPLTGIAIAIDNIRTCIERGNIDTAQKILAGIVHEPDRMAAIISKFLDIHKIETEGVQPVISTFNAVQCFRTVAMPYAERIEQKALIVEEAFAAEDILVQSDEFLVGQILDNIFSNALKFSPIGGKVTVSISSDTKSCCVMIRDQGAGIPKDELPHIFKKFAKISTKPTAGEKSTGIGLSIVHKLALALGGTVTVQSEPGEGTAFLVYIPVVYNKQ